MTTIDELIAGASASGGSERANYQLFITRLCAALGVPEPSFSSETNARNDYVFERSLDYRHLDGTSTKLFIDCYKRGHFVLEAKQSARRVASLPQGELFGSEASSRRLGQARRGSAGWDRVMRAAYTQAVDYTRHLPVEHGYPPFVILVDVGHVIELYADFSGQGKNYAQFPDAQSFRIGMEDLRKAEVQERLRAVWIDPQSLDPTKKSAEVTRDIAARLARIAKNLEGKHDARDVAEFLMRCLFTMFAEDVGLLPDKLMVNLLEQLVDNHTAFPPAMESLWKTMNVGGFEPHSMAVLKHFNGGLFATPRALPLAPEDIHELLVAARQDWRDVEPAIFGTLLERALDPRERSKLGAHYTPRAYVERLVVPTIIEPLRANWERAQAEIEDALRSNKLEQARTVARAFHHELCTVRVLDPACGTGNFLYVSLELLKKLEGEVLAAIEELGDDQTRLMMEGETVSPRQFFGLELNPRAVPIADLVLWIGFLKWQLRTVKLKDIPEPILRAYGTIRQQDAILAYDSRELVRGEAGVPVSRWDGHTRMLHPVTRELVPDPEARVEVYRYRNPRPALWPDADYIVGNPPFVGNKRMIERLGEGESEAIRLAYPDVPSSVDLVMYWWWKAAKLIREGEARGFGFVTTNKITQSFNRRVVEDALVGAPPVSLSFTIPDHPWNDDETSAAVRVAMTVVRPGQLIGTRQAIVFEGSDALQFQTSEGKILPSLRVSEADVSATRKLQANSLMAHQGVIPVGKGFRLEALEAEHLDGGNAMKDGLVRPYKIGRDLLQRDQGLFIIDLHGRDWPSVAQLYPQLAQVVLDRVKPQRDQNRRDKRRERFWLFADSCEDMRSAMLGTPRYIATCRTAKHRTFSYLAQEVLPDAKIVAITIDEPWELSVLSSRIHIGFANAAGGWQGVGNDPVYQHSDTFSPFPFPDLSAHPVLRSSLTELGQRLDDFRKDRLKAHKFLTVTSLYNVLERTRELEWRAGKGRDSDIVDQIDPLTESERAIYDAGRIPILKEIHDDIDRLVFAAYEWSDLASNIVGRPGATAPSPYKTDDQVIQEEKLLARLVALNQKRVVEENQGAVRWLRPDYQAPRLGRRIADHEGYHQSDLAILPGVEKPKWPGDSNEQIALLVDVLRRAPAPMLPDMLAARFDGRNTPKRRERIESLLETLTVIGLARTGQLDGRTRYFIPR